MNKYIKKIIIIILIIFLIYIISFIFKTNHEVEYKINVNKKTANIKEIYKNKRYHFKVKYKKNTYFFSIPDNYNKSKKILTKFKYFKKDDASCITPSLKESGTICIKNNELVSYNFVSLSEEKEFTTLGQLKIYEVPSDTYIYIWKYNGVYSVNNKESKKLDMFKNDTYVNTLGTSIGKYYIIPNYDEDYDYNTFYIYNMTNNKYKTIKLKEPISKDSYILGEVKDKLYIFDKDELKEYEINPKNKKVKIVGDKDKNGLYYDGSFIEKNIYDFKDELKFSEKYDVSIKADLIYKDNDIYYYYKNNTLYMYDSIFKKSIKIYDGSINNIKVFDNIIYFVSDNTLYSYSFNTSLVKVLTYEELSFNNTNRISIYKK